MITKLIYICTQFILKRFRVCLLQGVYSKIVMGDQTGTKPVSGLLLIGILGTHLSVSGSTCWGKTGYNNLLFSKGAFQCAMCSYYGYISQESSENKTGITINNVAVYLWSRDMCSLMSSVDYDVFMFNSYFAPWKYFCGVTCCNHNTFEIIIILKFNLL